MAPPRQSSLMNRNLWFLHALARAFTAPSFLSQNNPSRSAPVQLKLLPLLWIAAVILLILLIVIFMGNLQQPPPHSPKLQEPRLVSWNRYFKSHLTKRNQKNLCSVWPEIWQGQRNRDQSSQLKNTKTKCPKQTNKQNNKTNKQKTPEFWKVTYFH